MELWALKINPETKYIIYFSLFVTNIINGVIYYNIKGVLLNNTFYNCNYKMWKYLNTAKNSLYLEVKKMQYLYLKLYIYNFALRLYNC